MVDACCGPQSSPSELVKTRVVYWYILDSFPRLGRAPTIQDIERDLLFQRDEVIGILDSLAARGALRVEPAWHMILDAYPYSGVPTRHRVIFDDGTSLYCICAVDTFYVPFLTQGNLTTRSHCFYCRHPIEIRTEDCAIARAEPSDCVVWNSASSYDCPVTNFFCTKEHLLKWQEDVPDEQGRVFTLGEALSAGEKAVERMRQSRAGLHEIQWAPASELVCYCRQVPKATIVAAIRRGASTPQEIANQTTACTGRWCEEMNPKNRCCCVDLEALIEAYSRKGGE